MEIASLRFGLEWIYKTKVEIVNIGFENPNMKSFFIDGGLQDMEFKVCFKYEIKISCHLEYAYLSKFKL